MIKVKKKKERYGKKKIIKTIRKHLKLEEDRHRY